MFFEKFVVSSLFQTHACVGRATVSGALAQAAQEPDSVGVQVMALSTQQVELGLILFGLATSEERVLPFVASFVAREQLVAPPPMAIYLHAA